MPALSELVGTSTDPTVSQFVASNPVVEPLDGPTTVDDVMDRFPEEVYQQGRDTHLYRFLSALGGDSGAGLLKAQAFTARLKYEAEFVNFETLDQIYADQFQLRRLRVETYPDYNPVTDALTPTVWDMILLADQHYKQRCAEFFTATRLGNSPLALAFAAQAGSGAQAEVVENYRWIFDQYSDMPLGLEPIGTTISVNEFVVLLRTFQGFGDLTYEQKPAGYSYLFVAPTMDNVRPSVVDTPMTVSKDSNLADQSNSIPVINQQDVVRNTVEILDRLRPANTLATIRPDQFRYVDLGIDFPVTASSERVQLSRLVTGQESVPWPVMDATQNYFIEANIEKEAGYFYGSSRELPIVFLTVEQVSAYTEAAISDPLYGTNDFYDNSTGISAYDHYRSESEGFFSRFLVAIFPFLASLSQDTSYVAVNAVAIVNTPLMLEGSAVA